MPNQQLLFIFMVGDGPLVPLVSSDTELRRPDLEGWKGYRFPKSFRVSLVIWIFK